MLCFRLRIRLYGLSKQSSTLLISRRSVIIPSSITTRKRRRKIRDVSIDDLSLRGIDPSDSNALEFKVRQLQEFTRNLREHIKDADSSNKKLDIQRDVSGINKENDDKGAADLILNNLGSPSSSNLGNLASHENKDDLSSIIMSTESKEASRLLPEVIRDRINDDSFILASLLDKSHQNWNGIISKLYSSEARLNGISNQTLKKWLLSRANRLSYDNIENLDRMLLERVNGDISKFSTPMYECLFFNLAKLSPPLINDAVASKMKQLLKRYDQSKELSAEASKMTQFILNSCIKYSNKMLSFDNMEFFLSKFKNDYKISPNRENYTTIIQFYTKLGVSKQAWDVFDTMKFLSKSCAPDVTTYNSVLHLCNKDKDYSRAIDLYQEMKDKNLEPSVETLNIMAKTLARASSDPITSENKAESLRLLGWKYIHLIERESNERQYETHFFYTLEAMMALAAYDGDVGLARALYFKYITQRYKEVVNKWRGKIDRNKVWKHALNPQLFNYLLLAYSKYDAGTLPILLGYEKGITLRRNLMNSVDYSGRTDYDEEVKIKMPMLPVIDLNQPWQILSESRALWQFNLEYGGLINIREAPQGFSPEKLQEMVLGSATLEEFKFTLMHEVSKWKATLINHSILNPVSLTTFLTIPIRLCDKREFLLRLKEFSFQQQELDALVKQTYEGFLQLEGKKESIAANTEVKGASLWNENIQYNMGYFSSLKHKILANCTIYELMMKAAAAFDDNNLATKAWRDRGEFRKTLSFQKLDEKEKAKRDSQFAFLMVRFFASQKMFTDALGIIISSQKFIDWKYSMVKSLHQGLIEIEDEKSARILLEIVNKKSSAQILDEQIHELKF